MGSDWLKKFDAYARPVEDFRVRTTSGAIITAVCCVLMSILTVSEFVYFLKVDVVPSITLDRIRGETMPIVFNVTFPNIPCAMLGIDALDSTGEHKLNVEKNAFLQRIDRNGKKLSDLPRSEKTTTVQPDPNYCGPCYGAEKTPGQCCNTCDEVLAAYKERHWNVKSEQFEQCRKEGRIDEKPMQSDEGCVAFGEVQINKVSGNFHIAPGQSFQNGGYQHIHDISGLTDDINCTHIINYIGFGEKYPGIVNPLDGVVGVDKTGMTMFQYFIKVVPTTYVSHWGKKIETNQYTVSPHSRVIKRDGSIPGMPGFYLVYDLSPIAVSYVEHKRTFAHFLTGVCGIVGGVFALFSLFDNIVYTTAHTLRAKIDLGKDK